MKILPGDNISITFNSKKWMLDDKNTKEEIEYFQQDSFIIYSKVNEVFSYNNHGCQLSLSRSDSFSPYTLFLSDNSNSELIEVSFKIDSIFINEEYGNILDYKNEDMVIDAEANLLIFYEGGLPNIKRRQISIRK